MASLDRLRICCCSAVPLEVVVDVDDPSWVARGSNSFSPLLGMTGLGADGLAKYYSGTNGCGDLVHVLDFCPIQPLIFCFFVDILLRIAGYPIFNVHNSLLPIFLV